MDAIILVQEAAVPLLASAYDFAINVAVSSEGFVNMLRNFVGPLVLFALGIIALTFLVQRQTTQFIIFLVLAIVVLAIFYVPEWIGNLGQRFGGAAQSW